MCKVPLVMLLLQAKTATQRLQEEDFSVQTLAQNFQEEYRLFPPKSKNDHSKKCPINDCTYLPVDCTYF